MSAVVELVEALHEVVLAASLVVERGVVLAYHRVVVVVRTYEVGSLLLLVAEVVQIQETLVESQVQMVVACQMVA
jgi:endonuclease/exonuclease/phosphatase (EEP) superfamily protein YafD